VVKGETSRKRCRESVVVFAQDIVPETILDVLSSPNSIVRKYLDFGGRIVWIGDHPFWSKGKDHRRIHEGKSDREEIWRFGSHYAMLGVEVLIAESSSYCRWIGKWHEKMKSGWYSQRPVNVEVKGGCILEFDRLSLKIEPLAFANVTLLPCSFNGLVIADGRRLVRRLEHLT